MDSGLFILAFIIGLLVCLTIHELGHFVFAKIFKVRVLEFAIGIGPKLFGGKYKNSQYNMRILLLGAYVQMDSSKLQKLNKEIIEDDQLEEWFNPDVAKLSWFEYLGRMFGRENVGFYWKNYFNYNSYRKRYNKTFLNKDKYHVYEEAKNWEKLIITLGGVLFNLIMVVILVLIAVYGLNWQLTNVWESIERFYKGLWDIIIWTKPGTSGGAGGAIGEAMQMPFNEILLNVLISINFSLFLLNILPIPPLDGFKLVTILFNSVFKKDIPEKVEMVFQFIGLGFMGYLTIASLVQQVIWYS